MVHMQNSTLAGGVAIGAAADLYLHPSGAIGIGMVAGSLSVYGYQYLSDWMDTKLGIADTCGIHNLHGMPGVLGGIVSAIAIAASDGSDAYVTDIWLADYPFQYTSFQRQAGMQIAAIVVTMAMAIVSGVVVGYIMRCFTAPAHEFCDDDNFEIQQEPRLLPRVDQQDSLIVMRADTPRLI